MKSMFEDPLLLRWARVNPPITNTTKSMYVNRQMDEYIDMGFGPCSHVLYNGAMDPILMTWPYQLCHPD